MRRGKRAYNTTHTSFWRLLCVDGVVRGFEVGLVVEDFKIAKLLGMLIF